MIWPDKHIVVYKGEHNTYSSVLEFQEIIQDAIDKIPEKYKKEAKINITTHSCGCYNDYESCIEIYYVRPKTEEEIKKEERQGKYQERARIKALEKELMELKLKPRSKKT